MNGPPRKPAVPLRRAPSGGKETTIEATPITVPALDEPAAGRPRRSPAPARSAGGAANGPTRRATGSDQIQRRTATAPNLRRGPRRRHGSNGLLLLAITVVLAIILWLLFGEHGLTVLTVEHVPNATP